MDIQPDRASYRNRGGFLQRLISAYKTKRYLTKAGIEIVIKHNAEFWLSENAILEVGDGCTIQNFAFFQLTKPNPKVYIGKNCVIGRHAMITAKNLIRLGNNVLLGAHVQIVDTSHGISAGRIIQDQTAKIGEIVIGHDVWIGAGAKVLMNCHIGDGAVIGANAVVTRNIPENAITAGIPARIIKYRE